jgi:hypothetical protein
MKGTMVNIEMTRKVLEYIKDHPEEHSQEHWWVTYTDAGGCGTTRCMAGTAVHLAGMNAPGRRTMNSTWIKMGADILGLSFADAELMFISCNDLVELYRVANMYSNGAIEIPYLDAPVNHIDYVWNIRNYDGMISEREKLDKAFEAGKSRAD